MKCFSRLTALVALLALILTACGGAAAPQGGATSAPAESAAQPTAAAAQPTTQAAEPTAAAAEPTAAAAEPTAAAAEPTAAAAAGEKAKITMWLDTTGGADSANCIQENVINPFNEQSQTAEVETTMQANSWDATRTALAGGAGPDVVGTPGPSFAFNLAKAGQLLPLDEFAQSSGWSKSFVPWALNLGLVDGKLYSIPDEVETLVLYYNKTLFEQKGWQPPKTIDELMSLAEQIHAAGIIPFGHANAEWKAADEWFVGEFLNHVAGPQKVYEALTGKRQWDDPDFVRAVDMLNTIQQKGWFMGGLDRYYTAQFDEAHAALGNGTAAMNIEGTWFLGDINKFFGQEANNSNEWAWVPVPSASGEAIFDLGIGSTYSINKNTKNPKAVAEFLTYFFSPETQARRLSKCGMALAPVNLSADALKEIDARHVAIIEALNKASAANNYGYTTWTFWPPKSDEYIYNEVEKVWAGKTTSKQYLEGLQKLFAEEKAAGNIPPIPAR